jgi:para-nitrobenzyl esterase
VKRVFIAATILFAASVAAAPASEAPRVAIDSGVVVGTENSGVLSFKGIPYAAPPVGELRWMPPSPPKPWSEPRDASTFGPICPQPKRPGLTFITGELPQSEDCLSLNVFAPKSARNAPVMVWIHGGAHRFGSSASPVYGGTHFAQDGVVLVSINYRLGILGYFAHPALTQAAAPDAPLGNYGQMDQIAALRWVKANVARFGGDPTNVTVFGESAGGSSILHLLATQSARGLFAKAVVESGGGWFEPSSLSMKEQEGIEFASRVGLPGGQATLAQLRALPVEKTLDIPPKLGFGPFVDGRLVKETPTAAFADGDAIAVPLMIGSNSFEASLMRMFSIPASAFTARATPEIRAAYRSDASSEETLGQSLFTDYVMGAPAHWVAAQASMHAPSYLYHFSYVVSARRNREPGAGHGSEIPYVFATGSDLAAGYHVTLTDEDRAMEKLMHSCWVGFARTGKPDCTGGLAWPAYSRAADALMEFGTNAGPVAGFRKEEYDALQARMPATSVSAGAR